MKIPVGALIARRSGDRFATLTVDVEAFTNAMKTTIEHIISNISYEIYGKESKKGSTKEGKNDDIIFLKHTCDIVADEFNPSLLLMT